MPRIRAIDRSTSCIVSGERVPRRSNSRVRATARMLRQTATLAVSTPSAGDTRGRSGVGERELDTGTTTMSSSSMPVRISSTETMTAGRCLPGSPARAAPRATNHNSPRHGSGDAVICRVVPVALLVADGVFVRLGACGVAFGAEGRIMLSARREFGQESRDGYTALTGLGRKPVTSRDWDPDCRGRRSHTRSLDLSPRFGDLGGHAAQGGRQRRRGGLRLLRVSSCKPD